MSYSLFQFVFIIIYLTLTLPPWLFIQNDSICKVMTAKICQIGCKIDSLATPWAAVGPAARAGATAGPVAAQPAARANRRTRDQYASNLHSKNKQTTNVTTKNLVATHKQRAL